MSAAPNVIVFKVTYTDAAGTKTVHRFRGDFTFETLQSYVGSINFNQARVPVKLSYLDEDGDKVSLASALEWEECRTLHRASREHLLRLFAQQVSAGSKQASVTKRAPNPTNKKAPVKHADPVVEKPTPKAEAPAVVAKAASSDSDDEEPLEVRLMNLVAMGERPARVLLIKAIVAAMDRDEMDAAESLLETAITAYPNDAIIEYNMACVAALQKLPDRAIHFLERAVSHGYKNVDHMLHDADLANIRDHTGFTALIDRMAAGSVEKAPAASATPSDGKTAATAIDVDQVAKEEACEKVEIVFSPTATAIAALVITPPEGEVPRKVRDLLSLFPGLDAENAAALLKDHGDDLDLTVDTLLACQ